MSRADTALPGSATEAWDYCAQVTRKAATNFYYGLKLLPEPKRRQMFALYAYMRLLDDIADEQDGRSVQQRLDELESWREHTHMAMDGTLPPSGPLLMWQAFMITSQHRSLPVRVFDDAVDGHCQDVRGIRLDTFEQLHEYCYRVAGTVGVASIHIWGFEGGDATERLAVDRGVAMQLTNILRDLREDLCQGRIYLPREELAARNIREEDLRRSLDHSDQRLLDLLRFQIDRAETYYQRSRDLEQRISRDARCALTAMTEIYHRLLAKLSRSPQRVLKGRVSLSLPMKLFIGWRALRGASAGM